MELDIQKLKLMGKRCSIVWPIPSIKEISPFLILEQSQVNVSKRKYSKKKHKRNSRQKAIYQFPRLKEEQLNSIRGKIFVSNANAAKDRKLLVELQVTAMISVGGGSNGGTIPEIVKDFVHFGIQDRSESNYIPVFRDAIEFVHPIIYTGRNILVHCQGGMHRSPAVAAALLIRFARLSTTEAVNCIKASRPIADFASYDNHLIQQLTSYEAEVQADFDLKDVEIRKE